MRYFLFFYNIMLILVYGICSFGFSQLYFATRNRREKWAAILFAAYFFDNLLYAVIEFIPDIIPEFEQFDLVYPYISRGVKIALMLCYRMFLGHLLHYPPKTQERKVIFGAALGLMILNGFFNIPLGDVVYMLCASATVLAMIVQAFIMLRRSHNQFSPESGRVIFGLLCAWGGLYFGCYAVWFAALPMGGMNELARSLSSELLGAVCTGAAIVYLVKNLPNHAGAGLSEEELMRLFVSYYKLTPREAAILLMLLDGADNMAVSEKSCISLNTVKVHIHNIYQKLGVQRRTQIPKCFEDFKKQRNV